MSFAKNLRILRKQRKLTQEQLAKELGVSTSSVSMYENGKREADYETLEVIADYFNIDMNTLLGKSEIPLAMPLFNAYKSAIDPIQKAVCGLLGISRVTLDDDSRNPEESPEEEPNQKSRTTTSSGGMGTGPYKGPS